jgi:signal peptidase II
LNIISEEKKPDMPDENRHPERAMDWKVVAKHYAFLFGIAALIIIFDQFTKNWIRTNLAIGESWVPWNWLAPFVRLVHWKNTGAAFGLFQNASIVLAILAVIVSIAIIIYFPRIPKEEKLMRVAMVMMLGGALGNLVDRLTIGYVTDFISVGNFPVFNVADSSITVGVCILVLGMWISENKAKKLAEAKDLATKPEDPFSEETLEKPAAEEDQEQEQ